MSAKFNFKYVVETDDSAKIFPDLESALEFLTETANDGDVEMKLTRVIKGCPEGGNKYFIEDYTDNVKVVHSKLEVRGMLSYMNNTFEAIYIPA